MSLQTRLTINTVAITAGVVGTVFAIAAGRLDLTLMNVGVVALNVFIRTLIKE